MYNPFTQGMEDVPPLDEDGVARAGEPIDPATTAVATMDAVADAIREVYDPEIPVNIYELGLIYDIDIADDGTTAITMTLTAPGCPVAGILPGQVVQKAAAVAGVGEVSVRLVWDPPWDPSRMSEAARLELNMF